MNMFFHNANQSRSHQVPSIDSSKDCGVFILTQGIEDKEIFSAETPEQASAIISKRMAKVVEEEFNRLNLEA